MNAATRSTRFFLICLFAAAGLSVSVAQAQVLATVQLETRGTIDGLQESIDVRLGLRDADRSSASFAHLFAGLSITEADVGRTLVADVSSDARFSKFADTICDGNAYDLTWYACGETPRGAACHGSSTTAPRLRGAVVTEARLSFREIIVTYYYDRGLTRTAFAATLEIVGFFPPTAVETASWSTVKAKYRR